MAQSHQSFYIVVAALLCGIAIGVLGHVDNLLIGFLFFLGTVLVVFHIVKKDPVTLLFAIFALALSIGIIRGQQAPQKISAHFSALFGTYTSFTGMVTAMPDIRETSNRLTIDVNEGGEQTRLIAAVPLYPPVSVGTTVRVSGMLVQPKPFDTGGGRQFLYDKFLAKEGVFAVMNRARLEVVDTVTPSYWLRLLQVLERIKEKTSTAIRNSIGEPESALAIGILIGGKQGLGPELLRAFTVSGMLQIVVLSGYNVMIVAEAILFLLRPFPKKIALFVAGISIILFVLLSGAGSSAVRSGGMAILSILARLTSRPFGIVRVLLLTLAVMSLISPLSLLYDPGLQFSYLATLGLIIGTPIISRWLLSIKNVAARELCATTLAAQIGVLPILLWQTGNLSLVSLCSNVLSMPVIPFAMAASAIAAGVAFIIGGQHPILLTAIGLPAFIALWFVIHVATVSASIPFASITLPVFSFWFVIVAYGVMVVGITVYTKREPPLSSGRSLLHRYKPAPT
jgi:competence protein ComEC